MSESSGRLTVFFDDPFWVGVFERVEDDRIAACKVTFGAEPRDCEVWSFVLKNYDQLRFSPWVAETVREKAVNPKRVQRELRKRSRHTDIGTKAQQALQLQREETALAGKAAYRERRTAEQQRRFALKQQKRKEKRRGR